MTHEISASLLKVCEIGETARLGFIKECNEDPSRFEKPIKRCNIKTFQDATKKYKVRGQNEKTEAVAMVRDLFGSALFLSLQRKVDMAEVFCYPLTPVPLSLCHTDGTILSSPKAKLLTELESRVRSEAPTKIDAPVVDGMFFLHLLVDPPKTFKQIAIYLMRKMLNDFNCKNIHLVFDKVVSPSIKDLERNKRLSTRQDLSTITGPAQTRPSDWEAALQMDSLKTSFVKCLVSYWKNNKLFPFFKNKQLFVNYKDASNFLLKETALSKLKLRNCFQLTRKLIQECCFMLITYLHHQTLS